MSNAKPMGRERREVFYGYPHMTPRQWRRFLHKNRRAAQYEGERYDYMAKGQPTPRQRKRVRRG